MIRLAIGNLQSNIGENRKVVIGNMINVVHVLGVLSSSMRKQGAKY
ncbi:MAG: hypothetical protein FGF53_01740 [Candidatus Brockarchaeota archaeon]|nr:hypothetical protein [Candidatus Brockarchaeota archaeon]